MLTEYIQSAMRRAQYELLGDGTFFGEIPDCQGVWGNADTLKECQEDLQDSLEGWIVLGLRVGHVLPVINGINLTSPLVPLEEQEVA